MSKIHTTCLLSVALLLGSPSAGAFGFERGHIMPLASELLPDPIVLDCGVVIQEWRGVHIDAQAIEQVSAVCDLAVEAFVPFIARHGLSVVDDRPFYFTASFIPDTTDYRGLNDRRWRFANRSTRNEVWGYTSHTNSHIFILSDNRHPQFEATFVHELYHALSWYHGVFDSLPGATMTERFAQEERLAIQFEREVTRH